VKKWWIIGGVVVVVGLIAANMLTSGRQVPEVETVEIARKDLVETVSASGTLTPKRKVDVSANTMGRITRLAVAEGDTVLEGDFLLEVDPTEYESMVRSYEAAVATVEADLELTLATAAQSRSDRDRIESLHELGLVSDEQWQTATTSVSVEAARVESARARLRQAQANLDKGRHDLSKVTIRAPMSGVVTRLNVEEGENAVMGSLNMAGTVLLVIADLTTMEAEVDVDETEVVRVDVGQLVDVGIDAFPDTTFAGVVTEVGNSPIYTSTGQNRQAVDFKVTITLTDKIVGVRPGLSAKADIRVARSEGALALPIGAVMVRDWPPREEGKRRRGRSSEAASDTIDVEYQEKEGVFRLVDGVVSFVPVTLGITGEDDFEALSGVEEDWTIVTGPFRELRDLEHGDEVKIEKKKRGRRDDGES